MTNSEFKKAARQHQITYREKYISLEYNRYATWLSDADGQKGRNFYAGLGVFESVRQRYPQFYVDLYSDMLRSEHIPFNLFVPFRQNLEFCKNVFNEMMGDCIKSIENIQIEYAPSPKENYLNDGTSFDAYIEYTHINNSKGVIGIEVKYTEKEYPLDPKSKQAKDINDKHGKYYAISEKCGLYKPNTIETLKKDLFRQIWRNHLLAESIRLVDNDKFKHATSIIFIPKIMDILQKQIISTAKCWQTMTKSLFPLRMKIFWKHVKNIAPIMISKNGLTILMKDTLLNI
jgi:hypothetical protein